MSSYDSIEQQVVDALTAFPDKALKQDYSDAQWTKGIKIALGDLGAQCGFDICTAGLPNKFSSEWLFDMVWYKNDEQGHLVDLPLVLESEWSLSFDNIKYDFEKLLAARSPHRVLIYQAPTQAKVEEISRHLITEIAKFRYSQPGDRYLFAGYDFVTTCFNFRLFIY